MLYSKQTGGFYLKEVHDVIPADAVEICDELYHDLMNGQAEGKHIVVADNGLPMLVDTVEPSLEVKKAQRKNVLLKQLQDIDSRKVRAISDFILSGDKTRLADLEAAAVKIRTELTGIGE